MKIGNISYFEGSGINWMKIKGDVGSPGDSQVIFTLLIVMTQVLLFSGNNAITQNPNEYSKFMAKQL